MLKTMDQHLFWRFLLIVVQIFAALYGMYVVIDGFTNFDNFQDSLQHASLFEFWTQFIWHYALHTSLVFQMVASTLGILGMLIVFAQLRQGELYPILSSGVPTIRIALPIFWGVLVLNGLMIANQECLLPKLADHLQASQHGQNAGALQKVSPSYDQRLIYFAAERLSPSEHALLNATITLPHPHLVSEPTTLQVEKAVCLPRRSGKPAGWQLYGLSPPLSQLRLTPQGQQLLHPDSEGTFLISEMTWDQLRAGRESGRFLSTIELTTRLRHPPLGATNVKLQRYELHTRLTAPMVNLALIFVVMPLMLRKESQSVVLDIFSTLIVIAMIGVLAGVGQFLCGYGLLRSDMAAWLPVICAGICACLLSSRLKT